MPAATPTDVQIRKAGLEDQDEIVELFLRCCRNDDEFLPTVARTSGEISVWYRQKMIKYSWVAQDTNGAVIGSVAAALRPPPKEIATEFAATIELCRMAVIPHRQGEGIGSRLHEAFTAFSDSQQANSWLRCVKGSAAHTWYSHRGWVLISDTTFESPADIQPACVLWRSARNERKYIVDP